MSNAKSNPTDNDEPSFEEAYGRLEETVHALEEGGLSLAEATRLTLAALPPGEAAQQLEATIRAGQTPLGAIPASQGGPPAHAKGKAYGHDKPKGGDKGK